MADVVRVQKEHFPAMRFIGKRYTDADRDPIGGFAGRWQEWFRENRFAPLEALGPAPETGGATIGLIRLESTFEYWIGMFFPEGTAVPAGYDAVDLPASTFGTCWLYGRPDTGELFGEAAHALCVVHIERAGWRIADVPLCLEVYNCPRYTTPDAEGNVILDYCIQLAD